MKNNIDKLNFFLQSKEKVLLINQVNELISSFYIGIIKHIAIRNDVGISLSGDESKENIVIFSKDLTLISIRSNTKKLIFY